MAKSHRDNHQARKKRGEAAFATKRKRRAAVKKREAAKCPVCGDWRRSCRCRMVVVEA